jgi:hypothetical protein
MKKIQRLLHQLLPSWRTELRGVSIHASQNNQIVAHTLLCRFRPSDGHETSLLLGHESTIWSSNLATVIWCDIIGGRLDRVAGLKRFRNSCRAGRSARRLFKRCLRAFGLGISSRSRLSAHWSLGVRGGVLGRVELRLRSGLWQLLIVLACREVGVALQL